jgi:hypothetical protein
MSYYEKYLKYKNKYLELKTKKQTGGSNNSALGNPYSRIPKRTVRGNGFTTQSMIQPTNQPITQSMIQPTSQPVEADLGENEWKLVVGANYKGLGIYQGYLQAGPSHDPYKEHSFKKADSQYSYFYHTKHIKNEFIQQ